MPLHSPIDVAMMSWRLLSIKTYLGRLNEPLFIKGDSSCKSEWVVGCSTCSFTVGVAIFSHTERQRRSVFLKLNGNDLVRVYPWRAFSVWPCIIRLLI